MSLSPSACCVAIANGNSISFYQAGKVVLGLKGKNVQAKMFVCCISAPFITKVHIHIICYKTCADNPSLYISVPPAY